MSRSWRRSFRRALTVGAASAALLVMGVGIAAAQVDVDPGTVTAGSYATLTFTVPTDNDTASTTSVQIQIPPATPFASVSVRHLGGWTAELAESELSTPVTQGSVTFTRAVTSVTFTAQDGGIGPHEFATFDLLVGPVPDVGSISFTAVQTYSDGSIVRWNQPTTPGAAAPEYPAPSITIGEAGAAIGVSTGTVGDSQPPTDGRSNTDGIARLLGAAGIMIALVAIGVAANRGRPPTSPVPNSVLLGTSPTRTDRTPAGRERPPSSPKPGSNPGGQPPLP